MSNPRLATMLRTTTFISFLAACGESEEESGYSFPIGNVKERIVITPPPVTFTDLSDPNSYFTEFTPDGTIIHLEPDGSGNYPDLMTAVEVSEAGITINLAPGTYQLDRHLDVTRSLRLVGAGLEETRIVSLAPEYVVQFNGDRTFAAEGISFQHQGFLTDDGLFPKGGTVFSAKGGTVLISECEFTAGVERQGYGEDRIGIRLQGNTEALIQSSVMSGNDIGISVEDQALVTLEANLCFNNLVDGIIYSDKSRGVVRGNICSGNNNDGIALSGRSRTTLEENICTGNGGDGINYWGESGGMARRNVCSGNGVGISVHSSAQVNLEENILTENSWSGVIYSGESIGLVRGNDCSKNEEDGIIVLKSAQPTLAENICGENGMYGIFIASESPVVARDNE